jgi:hypothetical protein
MVFSVSAAARFLPSFVCSTRSSLCASLVCSTKPFVDWRPYLEEAEHGLDGWFLLGLGGSALLGGGARGAALICR